LQGFTFGAFPQPAERVTGPDTLKSTEDSNKPPEPRRFFFDLERAMQPITDDVRIREIKELTPPSHVLREFVCSERAAQVTYESRQAIHRILHDMDDRLLVIIGPCSIHDTKAAICQAADGPT
jgi:hypothetical protein